MAFTYQYPRAAVAVDCVVFGYDGSMLRVLLIQRGVAPFKGGWALPGGFVHPEESLDDAARRELREETGVDQLFMEQLYTFGKVDRDPRERVISVAYFALIPLAGQVLKADTDAQQARWFELGALPELAFDHDTILATALERLRSKLSYQPVGFELLPEKFTLSQLQRLYEVILDHPLDKRNFRKKLLKMGILEALDEREQNVAHRAAQFFRFDWEKYRRLSQADFAFDL